MLISISVTKCPLNLFVKPITNWCAWELVPSKVGGGGGKNNRQGGSMTTLWAGTSPASGHQQQRHTEGNSVENLPDPILTMNHFLWGVGRAGHWIGKIDNQSSDPQSSTEQANCSYGDQNSDPSKVVIHKDQRRRQLQVWWGGLTCKDMVRQALAVTPQIIETTGDICSRLTQPKLHLTTFIFGLFFY